jgi:hypothetical protein
VQPESRPLTGGIAYRYRGVVAGNAEL